MIISRFFMYVNLLSENQFFRNKNYLLTLLGLNGIIMVYSGQERTERKMNSTEKSTSALNTVIRILADIFIAVLALILIIQICAAIYIKTDLSAQWHGAVRSTSPDSRYVISISDETDGYFDEAEYIVSVCRSNAVISEFYLPKSYGEPHIEWEGNDLNISLTDKTGNKMLYSVRTEEQD